MESTIEPRDDFALSRLEQYRHPLYWLMPRYQASPYCVSVPPGANRFHQGRMVALGLVRIGGRKFRQG